MPLLLVSLNNVFPPGLALGVYDFDAAKFTWVDTSFVADDLKGMTGIARIGGAYWCVTQSMRKGHSMLLEFDERLQSRSTHDLEHVRMAHSIIPWEDGLLVVDTGGNRLIFVNPPSADRPMLEQEFWRYNDDLRDTVHVNSVAAVDGQVFVSLFGPRPEDGWRSARAGLIVNATTNDVVYDSLAQPHSLMNIDGELHWLESATGDFHQVNSAGEHRVLARVDGFARGLAFDDTYFYIGGSMARHGPHRAGSPNMDPLAPSDTHTLIHRIDRKHLAIVSRDISTIGAEIFDLVRLPGVGLNHLQSPIDPVLQRIWQIEDERKQYTDSMQAQVWQKKQVIVVAERALAKISDQLNKSAPDDTIQPNQRRIQASIAEIREYLRSNATMPVDD